jgi:hypothetical protein
MLSISGRKGRQQSTELMLNLNMKYETKDSIQSIASNSELNAMPKTLKLPSTIPHQIWVGRETQHKAVHSSSTLQAYSSASAIDEIPVPWPLTS